MATTCIFDDYFLKRRWSILFTDDSFKRVRDNWNNIDPLLEKICSFEFFAGKNTWSALEPQHLRVLIANVILNRDKLPEAEHFDEKHAEISNMYFLIMALVYHIMLKTTAAVDTIRISRVGQAQLTYQFTLSMIPEGKTEDAPKTGLHVIVDNTNKI